MCWESKYTFPFYVQINEDKDNNNAQVINPDKRARAQTNFYVETLQSEGKNHGTKSITSTM